ncbi:MAG: class I SAM-dependent methyltransferase [Gammaproteobacteria bacterium]
MQKHLPIPTPEQLERSKQLCTHIKNIIQAAQNGVISFAEYMQLVLYTPQLGYYMADHPIFGWEGDFTTAPELSALFANCLATPCRQVLEETGGDILELGAGSGKLAVELLKSLPEIPKNYYIYEISPALRKRQKEYIQKELPDLSQHIIWLEDLPKTFTGIIIANEVMDALPAECFILTEQGILERGIAVDNEVFTWKNYPANERMQEYLQRIETQELPVPYISEAQICLPEWIQKLSSILQRGTILFFDYGFPRREYYHPDRSMGTLMCYYRQFAHGDPFLYPGLQDITVHVDFTAVAEIAEANDLEVIGFVSQARFLIDAGLIDILQSNPDLSLANKHQIQILTSPAEMGELFKVMGLARNCNIPLAGFSGPSRAI